MDTHACTRSLILWIVPMDTSVDVQLFRARCLLGGGRGCYVERIESKPFYLIPNTSYLSCKTRRRNHISDLHMSMHANIQIYAYHLYIDTCTNTHCICVFPSVTVPCKQANTYTCPFVCVPWLVCKGLSNGDNFSVYDFLNATSVSIHLQWLFLLGVFQWFSLG